MRRSTRSKPGDKGSSSPLSGNHETAHSPIIQFIATLEEQKMAKAPDKPAAAPAEAEAPKSKKKLFIIIGVAILLLGAGGAAAWHFMAPQHDAKGAQHEPAKPPVFVNLEPFTVNLQPDGSEQYLQAGIVVQVKDQEAVDLLKLHMPQVRSRLLLLLSSKQSEDISTLEGKKKLTDEILAQLKLPFVEKEKPQEVSSVFFTDFVIQ
jgi:flagellar protein FliL